MIRANCRFCGGRGGRRLRNICSFSFRYACAFLCLPSLWITLLIPSKIHPLRQSNIQSPTRPYLLFLSHYLLVCREQLHFSVLFPSLWITLLNSIIPSKIHPLRQSNIQSPTRPNLLFLTHYLLVCREHRYFSVLSLSLDHLIKLYNPFKNTSPQAI